MSSSDHSLSGYAGTVHSTLLPLNKNKRFKRLFKNKTIKILFNGSYWLYAALVTIDKGSIRVEGVKNNPGKESTQVQPGWDVYIEMDIILYSRIISRRKTLFDLVKEWIKGNFKLRGKNHILDLVKLFNCLTKEKLTYDPPEVWNE